MNGTKKFANAVRMTQLGSTAQTRCPTIRTLCCWRHASMQLENLLRLLAFLVACCCIGSANANEVAVGQNPALKDDEGFALFAIDTNIALTRIRLDRIGSIFSFPKMENFTPGTHTRLLRLPAGKYAFTKFELGYWFWEFEDVPNSTFEVIAGKVNYIGKVRTRFSNSYLTLAIENHGLAALEGLNRDYPALAKAYPWRYAGSMPDPFVDVVDITKRQQSVSESVIDPSIEDRDAAEIYFRGAKAFASGLSPDGKYALETLSEGRDVAIKLIELDAALSRVIYTGVQMSNMYWVGNDVLAMTMNRPSIGKLLRIRSVDDVTEIPFAGASIVGVVPETDKVIVIANNTFKAVSVNEPLDNKSLRKAKSLRKLPPDGLVDYWIDGKGVLRLIQRPSKDKNILNFVYFDPETDEQLKFQVKYEKNTLLQFAGFDEQSRPLVLTDRGRDHVELVRFDPQTQAIAETALAIPGADILSAQWKINHQVGSVTYLNKGRQLTLSLRHANDQSLLGALARALPDRNIRLAGSSENGRMLVYTDGPQDPGTYHLLRDRKLQVLTVTTPHLDGRPLAKTERFVAKAQDGFEIESFLTMTNRPDRGTLPLLVIPHGGPFEVVDFKRFDQEVQYFASLGYAVLQVNFRGSGGQGKARVDLGVKQWGDRMISDINAAVDHAIGYYPVDAKRIAALGTSYGGYSAVRLAQTFPDRYKAAVGICGVFDLPLLFSAGAGSRTTRSIEWAKEHIGDPLSELELLKSHSPVYASNFSVPMLLVHDRSDQVAPFEHALRLRAAARAHGKSIELITVNSGNHGLVDSGLAIANYPKIATFLSRALNGQTAGDLGKQ